MEHGAQFRRLASVFCLVMAPALIVGAFVVAPFGNDETGKEIVSSVAANQWAYTWVPVVLAIAVLLLIAGVVTAIGLAAPRAPYLAYIGGGMAIAGYVALMSTFTAPQVALALSAAGVSPEQAATVIDKLNGGSVVLNLLSVVFVAGHILGTTILGVALVRARVVAIWAGALVVVSQPIHLVAHIIESKPADLVAFTLLGIGFWAVALRVWRTAPAPARHLATAPVPTPA